MEYKQENMKQISEQAKNPSYISKIGSKIKKGLGYIGKGTMVALLTYMLSKGASNVAAQNTAGNHIVSGNYRSEGQVANAGYSYFKGDKTRANATVSNTGTQGTTGSLGLNHNFTYLGFGGNVRGGEDMFGWTLNSLIRTADKKYRLRLNYGQSDESSQDNGIVSMVNTREMGAGAEANFKNDNFSLDYQNIDVDVDVTIPGMPAQTIDALVHVGVGAYTHDFGDRLLQNATLLGIYVDDQTNQSFTLLGILKEQFGKKVGLVNGLGYNFQNDEWNYLANLIIGSQSNNQSKDVKDNEVRRRIRKNSVLTNDDLRRLAREESGQYLLNSVIAVSGSEGPNTSDLNANFRVNFGGLGSFLPLIGPEVFYMSYNFQVPGTNLNLEQSRVGGGLNLLFGRGFDAKIMGYKLTKQDGTSEKHATAQLRKKFRTGKRKNLRKKQSR